MLELSVTPPGSGKVPPVVVEEAQQLTDLTALVAAPRGGIAVAVEVGSGRYLGHHAMPGVFGVAPRTVDNGFVLVSGSGELGILNHTGTALAIKPQSAVAAWDNHVALVR